VSYTMISVIVPTYNRVHQLPRALDSILCQSCSPKEIIVVDDGSTDETSALMTSEYPEIVFIQQQNTGVSSARNVGIKRASGDWIAFLDSDDEWLPEKLEIQMKALYENPGEKICHTNEIWIRNGKRVNPKKKHEKFGGWIFQKCLPLCCISPSSVIIHKSIFKEIGLFDYSLPVCEDYDLWLRITARNPVLYIEEPFLIKYGGHEDQLSKKYWGMDRFRIKSLEKIISSRVLSDLDANAAKKMLMEKIYIFIQGAQKRGNIKEVKKFKEQYSAFLQ
ncbi:uncharacterized protein METZ01_LOCUS72391, partial [marine metagenome]